jgi:hypothetical protein
MKEIADCGLRIAQWRAGLAVGFSLVLAGLLSASCQTKTTDASKPEIPAITEFTPATCIAGIQHEQGSYPNLFSPESYAVWMGAEVAALRRAKAEKDSEKIDPKIDAAVKRLTENYLILECHMASVFPDMSIAYDVVGLRGIGIHLLTPDGRKITPIQAVVAGTAQEERQEALRKFTRINLVLFQKRDLWVGKPVVALRAPSVRLVLEGYGSLFRFEWPNALPPSKPWIPNQEEYLKALKVGFQESYARLAEFLHTFD